MLGWQFYQGYADQQAISKDLANAKEMTELSDRVASGHAEARKLGKEAEKAYVAKVKEEMVARQRATSRAAE